MRKKEELALILFEQKRTFKDQIFAFYLIFHKFYFPLFQTKSDVESGHVQTVSALTLQVKELEERRKQEEERRREEEERREGLAREVEKLKKEAEERQKAVEEAEKLREELAAKKLEAGKE